MSSFYIGQRVKKVRGEWNLGMTGVVLGYGHPDASGFNHCLRVCVDAPWVGCDGPHPARSWGVFLAGHFEPTITPGIEPLTEINALYEPEPVSA